ncbi:hypothetical protein CH63R_06864 [Colletotrichum higginsianum IMI 349063]|uniref:Uncharacterized protein n=1 Tax=Colletotrichum higginsianum (strain IMI 349063) TaxID=759273 RepID=A0A1B7YGR4_COLHI|nr:hypothetical protein CH63R_06864 [Colletotrichum higginsianum IMI 349063]OBR11172.1 hypothetical protein CH63R_06864 [Colletotrichum higginsianum IMI 349063]
MANCVSVDHVVLRTGTLKEVAQYLKQIRSTTTDPVAITSHLHDAVLQGSIPQGIFSLWTPIANDPQSIIQGLRQADSLSERDAAIRAFVKALRSSKTMTPVWDAAAGARGVADIMSNLSIDEVKGLCSGLAKTASLSNGRSERHAKLTALVSILGADASQSRNNPDKRPLLRYYKQIIPACTTDRVAEYEETAPKWTTRQRSILLRTHPTIYEAKFLESIFLSKDTKAKLAEIDEQTWTQLINNDYAFGKRLLLRFLDCGAKLPVEPDVFMDKLAKPLASRLRRKRPAAQQHLTLEILELLVQLVKIHPSLADKLNESLTGVVFYTIKLWEMARSKRPLIEQHLVDLLKLVPDNKFKSVDSIVSFLRAVNPAVSYRLFRLMILNLQFYGFDVDRASGEIDDSIKKLKGPWPASLFTTTFGIKDRQASLRLFERLAALSPDGSFLGSAIEAQSSIFDRCRDPDSDRGDSEVLQVFLSRTSTIESGQEQDVANIVETCIQERKNKASSSRDWEGRAFWAVSALNMSIASGSLDIYAETLLWARRFNKDSNTVRHIYDSGNLHTTEGRGLLSGISETSHSTARQDSDVAAGVRFANKIMLQLLETASMALREPGFQKWDWNSVIALPAAVVAQRFRLVNEFQDAWKLTDARVFDLVWKLSLELLLDAERFLLRPGLQRLYPSCLSGLLKSSAVNDFGDFSVRAPAARFVDDLAKARDELWQAYRSREFPAVLTLGEPWPRGLPVQCLFPDELPGFINIDRLPYILSRIEKVVFGDPVVLLRELPRDKETRSAIGPCADSYGFALRAYINRPSDDSDKENLARKAWRHAVDDLCRTRMTIEASLRFWAEHFDGNGIKLPLDLRAEIPRRPEPVMPPVDDPSSPTEWHPSQSNASLDFQDSSTVPATILDHMLENWSSWFESLGLFDDVAWKVSVEVAASGTGSFWNMSTLIWPVSGKGADAILASVLLTVNTTEGSDNSILKQPFPSENNTRYPALYLDQEFLETVEEDHSWLSDSRINRIIGSGPPELLAQVVESVLQKVEAIERNEPEGIPPIRFAMTLVKLLSYSDRPSLAFPLVRDIILNRPGDSAWHRELLHKGFFNRLQPADAKNLLGMISDGVQEKLDQQSARAKEAKEQSVEPAPQRTPPIKVTTVKMLAKLLSDAPFLDVSSALDVLASLVAKAQHIDIRVAIIEALFNTLESETASSEVTTRILSLLEQFAVPLAASLNELRPITEADWADAEAGSQVPHVATQREQSAAPIHNLFFHLDKRVGFDPETKRRLAEMTARLVEQSSENNQRWTQLFLKKHGFSDVPENKLPLSPVNPDVFKIFSRSPEYLDLSTFKMLRGLVLANLRPSAGLAAVTKKVERDPVLSDSNAGKHWLALYGRGKFTMSRYGCTDILAEMHRNITSREVVDPSERVPSDLVRKFAHQIADRLVSSGDSSYVTALFTKMTSAMVDEKSLDALKRWKVTTMPVLEQIVARITKLRTPTWQRDPKRRPRELPSTFRLKVAMLAVPPGLGLDQAFAENVLMLTRELAKSTVSYHDDWAHLKYRALHYHKDWRPRFAHLALLFGSLDDINIESPTLIDHLRFDMAKQFAEHAYDPKDKDVVTRLKAMLRSWAECPVEDFRNAARDTLDKLQHGFGREWFNTGEDLEWVGSDSDCVSEMDD